jgi:peptidoglycan/xylan/chitin deacetylase (PgdA/CDA1 family)
MPIKICFTSIDIEQDLKKDSFLGVENLEAVLVIFKKYQVSATLFVTGEVLQKYSSLAKEWAKNYEIASHSFTHRFWNSLNLEERKEEIDKFIDLYSQIFQISPKGFRAPSHIIDEPGTNLLAERGFIYDSSVVPHYPPFKKYRGYKGKKPLLPYKLENGVLEIPVSGQIMGLPLAGAWIRGLPVWIYRILFIFHRPSFITLNMHSWDILDKCFLNKLEEIIKILKKNGYQFSNGEQILKNNQ